jgi:hypothetical protein
MKWKLFVSGMVLMAAGCSTPNSPTAPLEEFGYDYDDSSPPVPERSSLDLGSDVSPPLYPVATGAEITGRPAPYYILSTSYP